MATTNGHPATPPPSDPASKPDSSSQSKQQAAPDPDVPLTSAQDDGLSKRPRDARLIHVILSSLGIHSYQERVPLQLLDFAYRYTSSVLSDSLRLSAEGYSSTAGGGDTKGRRGAAAAAAAAAAGGDDSSAITTQALRQAIASRQGYTFQGPLPKEFMLEQAAERNRVALPKIENPYGLQLPPEKYCLTGVGWGLKNEWDSEEEMVDDEGGGVKAGEKMVRSVSGIAAEKEDERMGGVDGEEDEDEEGAGRMEDVFGGDEGADTNMTQD